jgi:hypothetical protein
MSNAEKEKFSTYPHRKYQKTWKIKDFEKVIHIIHIKKPLLCELLGCEKERMFW